MTIVSFILFLAFAGALTWFIVRKQDVGSNTGFFLAGRSLTYPLIAASLLLTNLSTEQMVGLNGSAFRQGLCVMAWEVVAVVSLVAMAWFFLPKFLKSGVTTVPEYLELRYGKSTGTIANAADSVHGRCRAPSDPRLQHAPPRPHRHADPLDRDLADRPHGLRLLAVRRPPHLRRA